MAIKVTKVDVWVSEIPDQPGGLADFLAPLADAGADLECVIARRQPDKAGMGVLFVSPIKGRKVQNAATAAGFKRAPFIGTLRIEGPNRAGLGARLARAVAEADINGRGLSAMTCGNKFVAYFGFDSDADAAKAMKAIKAVGGAPARRRPRRKLAVR